MPVGLVLGVLGASIVIALGVILAAVGAIEEAVVGLALGTWWLVRCCRRL